MPKMVYTRTHVHIIPKSLAGQSFSIMESEDVYGRDAQLGHNYTPPISVWVWALRMSKVRRDVSGIVVAANTTHKPC